jgi:hypothetical protein
MSLRWSPNGVREAGIPVDVLDSLLHRSLVDPTVKDGHLVSAIDQPLDDVRPSRTRPADDKCIHARSRDRTQTGASRTGS